MCASVCVVISILMSVKYVPRRCAYAIAGRCVGGPLVEVMTITTDILGQLRREWRRVGHTPLACASFTRLRDCHPDLDWEGLSDLFDVVEALESRSGRNVIERAKIVQALLEGASDPQVHRALLQTLIPGIVSVCRQLRFGDGVVKDPSDTLTMALGITYEVLTDWAGESRQYAAPDILSAVRGRLRRWMLKEKAAQRLISNFELDDNPATESSPLLARLHGYQDSQYDRLARLTYERVFEGRSLREIAAKDHSAPNSLQKELRQFAVHFLI